MRDPGCVPYNWLADEPQCYPADDNGIPAARQSSGRVLDAKWVVGFAPGHLDLNVFFVPFFGRAFIVPSVPGNFVAHYGDWSDLDADGSLDLGEWSGDGTGFVVSYVTPAVHTGGGVLRTGGSTSPDVTYVTTTAPEGARHVGSLPSVTFVDHSILETTAVWTLANPTFSPGGSLDWSPSPGEPWDTDLYASVDPSLESLYQWTVQGAV